MFCFCQLHYELCISIDMCTNMQMVQKQLQYGADPNKIKNEVSFGLNDVRVGALGGTDELLLAAAGKHI